jgi:ankyrin
MYAPPKARVAKSTSSARGGATPGGSSMMGTSMSGLSSSTRPGSGGGKKRKSGKVKTDAQGRVVPDFFLKQCMHLALKAGPDPTEQAKVLKRFEAHDVDIETSDKDGNSLLLMVAATPDVDVSFGKLLVQVGHAATVAKNNQAQTALHMAAAAGNIPMARYLLGAEEQTDYGTEKGEGQKQIALIVADVEDIYSETPLHHAARHGMLDMITLLLYHGADPDNESAKNQTPLLVAAEESQVEAADRLIQWGAAIGFEDADGATPLHKACKSGALTLVKQLLEAEADVNALEGDGFTAVHWAANQGHIVVLNLLCDRGADVNLQVRPPDAQLTRTELAADSQLTCC